jgi:hypothetical protein
MANSSAVSSGDLATANQLNNIRDDAISTSSGHMHDGSNGRVHTDDTLFILGTSSDVVLVLRSTALSATTTLTGVVEGTAATLATAANSLMISNVTDDGDVHIMVSKGGSTHTAFLADGSTGDTILNAATGQSVDMYIAGTKEMDFDASGINLASGNDLRINGTSVLNATTLGSAVVASSLTSVGTLTALTVDDVAINGKVITMTGDTDDTAVLTAGTHGTLSIVTTDTAGGAADVTLDVDGEIVLDAADAAGVIAKINGTAQLSIVDGSITPTTNNDIDLGTASYQFKNGYFDGTLEADAVTIGGTNVVTGSLVTTLGTVTAGVWNGTTVAVANGGTGATSLTDKAVLISQDSGTDTLGSVALTTSGQIIIGGASGPAAATLTAGDGIDITNGDGSIEIISETASLTNPGMAELATTAETSSGTDTGRVVTPDGLSQSVHGQRVIQMVVVDFATALTVQASGAFWFHVPSTLNGFDIVDVHAEVITAGAGGDLITIDLYNVTQSGDILSTNITIDAGETGSDSAATAAVIDTGQDGLQTNDVIRVDIDQIGNTTAGSGLIVTLICKIPD